MTLAVQMKSGGSLTETLQTLGDTVRQRVALAARAKALAGEVIFSSRALSAAPLIVGGLLYWINPESVDLLFYRSDWKDAPGLRSSLSAYGVSGDTLDDQKGYIDMNDYVVWIVALSFTGSFVLLTAAVLLIAREMQIRTLNARVSLAIVGLATHSTPYHRIFSWVSALGTRYRRFYSPENLEQLRTVVQASGFNPHRMMPVIIGGKTLSMLLFPLIAAFASQFMSHITE